MRKIFLPDHLLVFLLELPPDFRAFFVGDEEAPSSSFPDFFFEDFCSPSFCDLLGEREVDRPDRF